MENATKALIIAASVLIAMVLIAVGINILSSTSGVTDTVDSTSEAMSLSVFNSQFTDYEGNQTGTQVKALLNKAIATYRDGSGHQVEVNGNDSTATISEYRSTIISTDTYFVICYYDSYGYVNNISISIIN